MKPYLQKKKEHVLFHIFISLHRGATLVIEGNGSVEV